MQSLSIIPAVLFFTNCVQCYNILAIFPDPSRSHFMVFEPLLKSLAEKGHSLTVISYYPQRKPLDGYRDISLDKIGQPKYNVFDINEPFGFRIEKYISPFILARIGYESCTNGFASREVRDLIRFNGTFDLLITEFFTTDCFLAFAHKFKIPVIGVSSCTMKVFHSDRFGNPDNPAYIPNNEMDYSDEMSFIERVENTVMGVYHRLVWRYLVDIPANMVVKYYFGEDVPNLTDLSYQVSAMLVNTHFSLTFPKPQVPNVIDVGGLHIGKQEELPQVIAIDCSAYKLSALLVGKFDTSIKLRS